MDPLRPLRDFRDNWLGRPKSSSGSSDADILRRLVEARHTAQQEKTAQAQFALEQVWGEAERHIRDKS